MECGRVWARVSTYSERYSGAAGLGLASVSAMVGQENKVWTFFHKKFSNSLTSRAILMPFS